MSIEHFKALLERSTDELMAAGRELGAETLSRVEEYKQTVLLLGVEVAGGVITQSEALTSVEQVKAALEEDALIAASAAKTALLDKTHTIAVTAIKTAATLII